jgi:hypothetical protein
MTVRADLLEAARELAEGLAGVPNGKVVYAGAKGVRPEKPYLTIRITSHVAIGGTERIDGEDAGDPTATMRQLREASVSIQGFGEDSLDWLDTIQTSLDSPDSLTLQDEWGIAALLRSPVTEISALLDNEEEQRFSLELTLRHRYDAPIQTGVPLERVEVTGDLQRYAGDPDTLPLDFALDADGNLTTPP